jgi:hypothetical protein
VPLALSTLQAGTLIWLLTLESFYLFQPMGLAEMAFKK